MNASREPKVLVSIIIPTIGRRARLERTILTLLDQTLEPRLYEVIVVDDASSETYEWLPERVQVMRRSSRGGPGGARNTGLAAAVGDFVAFTDDDCLVPREWLSSLLDAFHRYPAASAVGGPLMPDVSHLDAAPARLERRQALDYYRRMNVDPFHQERVAPADVSTAWGTNNLAWRAAPLRALGGFLEGTSASEDRDLAQRAGAAGHFAVIHAGGGAPQPRVLVEGPVAPPRVRATTWTWKARCGGHREVRLPSARGIRPRSLVGVGAGPGPAHRCPTERRRVLRGGRPRCHVPQEAE